MVQCTDDYKTPDFLEMDTTNKCVMQIVLTCFMLDHAVRTMSYSTLLNKNIFKFVHFIDSTGRL